MCWYIISCILFFLVEEEYQVCGVWMVAFVYYALIKVSKANHIFEFGLLSEICWRLEVWMIFIGFGIYSLELVQLFYTCLQFSIWGANEILTHTTKDLLKLTWSNVIAPATNIKKEKKNSIWVYTGFKEKCEHERWNHEKV